MSVDKVENYTAQLMSSKGMLQEVWKSTHAVVKSSDVKLVKDQKGNAKNVTEAVKQHVPQFELVGQLALVSGT